jgi:hypothetical protein
MSNVTILSILSGLSLGDLERIIIGSPCSAVDCRLVGDIEAESQVEWMDHVLDEWARRVTARPCGRCGRLPSSAAFTSS